MLTKCPKIMEEEELLKDNPIVKQYNEEHAELFEHLGKHTGKKIEDATSARSIYTNLNIEVTISQTVYKFSMINEF